MGPIVGVSVHVYERGPGPIHHGRTPTESCPITMGPAGRACTRASLTECKRRERRWPPPAGWMSRGSGGQGRCLGGGRGRRCVSGGSGLLARLALRHQPWLPAVPNRDGAGHEAVEQRMRPLGPALELGVELARDE